MGGSSRHLHKFLWAILRGITQVFMGGSSRHLHKFLWAILRGIYTSIYGRFFAALPPDVREVYDLVYDLPEAGFFSFSGAMPGAMPPAHKIWGIATEKQTPSAEGHSHFRTSNGMRIAKR